MARTHKKQKKNINKLKYHCCQHYLVCIHFASYELWPPELQSLLQREANAFEEEAVLHTTTVAEMVVLSKALVELPHTEWEWFFWKLMADNNRWLTCSCGLLLYICTSKYLVLFSLNVSTQSIPQANLHLEPDILRRWSVQLTESICSKEIFPTFFWML